MKALLRDGPRDGEWIDFAWAMDITGGCNTINFPVYHDFGPREFHAMSFGAEPIFSPAPVASYRLERQDVLEIKDGVRTVYEAPYYVGVYQP